MTEISVEPYRKLIIRTYMKYNSYEEMARELTKGVIGVPSIILRWSHGIVFTFTSYQPTDHVLRQLIEGILYWDHVDFAEMPNYMSEISVAGSPVKIFVRNLNGHPLFDQVAEFLKTKLL
ncbi:MAG: hypothetical protein C0167_00815 [Nitrososphaera sp.]|jgi:hypothetical protein|nr:MAG: hypothetical protein C0167_00815 [Nitrososphaera sp.]